MDITYYCYLQVEKQLHELPIYTTPEPQNMLLMLFYTTKKCTVLLYKMWGKSLPLEPIMNLIAKIVLLKTA